MNEREKQKIIDTAVRGVMKGLEKPDAKLRPDFLEWLADRYIDFFPHDGVEITIRVGDELRGRGIQV